MEIADLPVFPGRHHSLCKSNDGPAVDRQAFTLESRLHQPALPEPKVPLAHEQSFAEDRSESRPEVLREIAVVRDQDILDVIRVVEKHGALPAEAQAHDVTIVTGTAREEAKGIAFVFPQIAAQEMAPGS